VKLPDFSLERTYWKSGFTVVGIDEVGRGAFAGPVGVGGVVFDPKMSLKQQKHLLSLGINDSKKLTSKRRLELSRVIKDNCLAYDIRFINVETINRIGVGKAAFEGMREVSKSLISKLQTPNPYLLIDGFEIPGYSKSLQTGIVYGDSLSISIASASIIAKVERDMLMEEIGDNFPGYFWNNNKGYGTLTHRKAISKLGLSEHHRPVFCQRTLGSL
jgi:ribonuclease HII